MDYLSKVKEIVAEQLNIAADDITAETRFEDVNA